MKKALLLLLFIYGSATILSAQKKFELHITGITANVNSTTVPFDSIQLNSTVSLNISFQNEGAFPIINSQYQQDTFPGGTYNFDFNVDSDNSGPPYKIDFQHKLFLNAIPYGQTETVTYDFTATSAFFKPGKNNIVIVWPSGGKAVSGIDSIDSTIPKGTYRIYVFPEAKTAGIPNLSTKNAFNIYPNPAKDVVNIQMKEAGEGMIRLMDMTGKLITSKPYSAKAGENINLPLNQGTVIPDGLYLISIETGNSSNVSKIMICM